MLQKIKQRKIVLFHLLIRHKLLIGIDQKRYRIQQGFSPAVLFKAFDVFYIKNHRQFIAFDGEMHSFCYRVYISKSLRRDPGLDDADI